MGFLAKVGVTVTGVIIAIDHNLITSPFVFAVSYFFFLVIATYLWFRLKDRQISQQLIDKHLDKTAQ